MATSLPVSDEELLELVRLEQSAHGWADGFLVSLRYRCSRPGPDGWGRASAPATISWTVALRRLEAAGELERVELFSRRGRHAGFGFVLTQSR